MYFGAKEINAVTFPHIAQRKHEFLGKIYEMSKKEKITRKKEIGLELLHQRIGQRSTRSLLAGNNANV